MSLIPMDEGDFEPDLFQDRIRSVLQPLVNIADAYDRNDLDDEARKFWGEDNENINATPPEKIILYSGRGGGTLLTLADCFRAREVTGKKDQ